MNKAVPFPWFIFLLPVFYTWHVYNAHFGIFNIGLVLEFTVYYILMAAAVFALGFLILRNRVKAAVWTICLLLVYFFFGAFHDLLKKIGLPRFFVSYTFLLSLGLVAVVFFTYRLKKSNAPVRLNRFFAYLTGLLLCIEIGTSLFYLFTNEIKRINPAGDNDPLNPVLKIKDQSQAPDIYFMVFDEYASSKALQKYLGFDNSKLDSTLENAGFYIATNSQSNYNATSLSLGSTFNLEYFNRDLENTPNNPYSLLQGAYSLKHSLLPELLERAGYRVVNHGLCDLKNYPVQVRPLFHEYAIKALYYETFWGRIKKDILWNLTVRLPGYKNTSPPDMNIIGRNQKNFSRFFHELSAPDDQPKFVYGHVFIPHRPALVDRYGKPRMVSNVEISDSEMDSLYLDQVRFVNTWIDSLVKSAINTKRDRPLVLILEGDHGNRYGESSRAIREKQFMNLNTYYFSDKDYSLLYDSISPVNSFRVVLNKYFDAGLPLLKDSTIRLAD